MKISISKVPNSVPRRMFDRCAQLRFLTRSGSQRSRVMLVSTSTCRLEGWKRPCRIKLTRRQRGTEISSTVEARSQQCSSTLTAVFKHAHSSVQSDGTKDAVISEHCGILTVVFLFLHLLPPLVIPLLVFNLYILLPHAHSGRESRSSQTARCQVWWRMHRFAFEMKRGPWTLR